MPTIAVAASLELASKSLIFIASFIIARLYTPHDLGVWNVVQTYLFFVLILVEFSCHQNGVRLLSADSNSGRSLAPLRLTILAFKLCGFLTICILLPLATIYKLISPIVMVSLLLFSIGVLINHDYYFRSVNRPLISAWQNISIGVTLIAATFVPLVCSAPIESAILFRAVCYLVICLLFTFSFAPLHLGSLASLPQNYKSHFGTFSIVLTGAILARLLSTVSVIFIDGILTSEETGLYSAAALFYMGFTTFKGVILTQTFPHLCAKHIKGNYFSSVNGYMKKVAPFVAVALIITTPNADSLLSTIFGADYNTEQSRNALQILLVLIGVQTVLLFIPNYLHVAGHSKHFLAIMAGTSLLNIPSTYFSVQHFGISGAASSLFIAECVIAIYCLRIYFRDAKR